MLIGISGSAGAGKDTLAEYLWRTHTFTRIAFADPMKRATQAIFGLSDEQTWSRDLKEISIPYWGLSPRRMFQMVGTDAMQGTFGRDVWLKRWKLSYEMVKDSENVVVPDVRFPQEAELIRELGGYIIQLNRKCENGLDAEAKAHVSEAGISVKYLDFVLHNDSSIDDMCLQMADFIEEKVS